MDRIDSADLDRQMRLAALAGVPDTEPEFRSGLRKMLATENERKRGRTRAGVTRPDMVHNLDAHFLSLARAVGEGGQPPAGRLLGLPVLADGDCWVDIAGAAALAGVKPSTITSWLARGGPRRRPFPAATRLLYRLYWPMRTITAWREE